MVEEETIKAVLEEESGLREKAEKLVALANENGGEDNITVTLVRIEPGTADDTPARESRNILVVEDDQILRDSIHSLLETTSYTVDSVEDGEKALKMLQKNRYTAIILDNYLPFIHGAELLGLIRATDPDVKIIVMSGFLNPEIIDSVKHNKADLILEKPLDFEALGNFLKTIE
jgi:CheY-like chemotaxis protein